MFAHRSGALALVLALVWPVVARATTAADVCAPAVDPCILNTTITVGPASTLDFGGRRFRVTSRGRLRIPFGDTLTIRARSVTLEPGALIDHAATTGDFNASLIVEAQEDIELQSASQRSGRISFSAARGLGSVSLTALGNVTVEGDVVVTPTTADGDGGLVQVVSVGNTTVGSNVRVYGGSGDGFGGKLAVQAGGAVVVNGGIVDASGGSGGGEVNLSAGLGVTSTATLDVRGMGGGTDGGTVTMVAAGDIRLQGAILGRGFGSLDFGGSGGDINFSAGGSVFLAAPITIPGGIPDGEGGSVEATAGVDVLLTARITASSSLVEGAGGTVSLTARRRLMLSAPVDLQGSPEGNGGAFSGQANEIRADSDIDVDGDTGSIELFTASVTAAQVVTGPIVVTGDLHTLGRGAGAGGDITLEACDITVASGGDLRTSGASAGQNLLRASRQMSLGGVLTATPDGTNLIEYRDPTRPPSILGTASIAPAARISLVPTLRVCQPPGVSICGNHVPEAGESCDDGNTTACDGCSPTCQVEACGNGVRECTEACDDGDAVNGDGCDANCTATGCGNGIVAGDEQCDDGNRTSGDGCSSACLVERPPGCGNNAVEPGEQCDDGNTASCDGCSSVCLTESCGNNVQECAEQCDDGNTVPGDGCSATCRTEGCGNGVLDEGEECDDGNTSNTDCCSSSCQAEPSLDVDGNGQTDAATDIVYISRRLLGLVPVPPSFRTPGTTIPPDDVIGARVDALGLRLDVDASGSVGAATDVVYIARHFLGLSPVPPSFRAANPSIPPDGTISGNIQGICGGT